MGSHRVDKTTVLPPFNEGNIRQCYMGQNLKMEEREREEKVQATGCYIMIMKKKGATVDPGCFGMTDGIGSATFDGIS